MGRDITAYGELKGHELDDVTCPVFLIDDDNPEVFRRTTYRSDCRGRASCNCCVCVLQR